MERRRRRHFERARMWRLEWARCVGFVRVCEPPAGAREHARVAVLFRQAHGPNRATVLVQGKV